MSKFKKTFLSLVACVCACIMFSTPVFAASNYFSKGLTTMNSLGGQSNICTVTSGSCSGTSSSRSITSVTVYGVLTGSSCKVYVESPSGTTAYLTKTSTGTQTFSTQFDGEDPYGSWSVYIVSNGSVSTLKSGSLKVYYDY